MPLLSVVVPAYNEEASIAYAVDSLRDTLQAAGIAHEIIFVDDGSTDGTYRAIARAGQADARVRGIRFSRNFGKEAAIMAGLGEARGDCAVVIDCDMQQPPSAIPEMVARWQQGAKVVEGVKASRGTESRAHRLGAGLFYRIISRVSGYDMRDASDYKLLDATVVQALLALPERNTFFRGLSFWVGFPSEKVAYEVADRQNGRTKWPLSKLVRYAVANITSFSTSPLQAVTVMGVIFLIFSLALAIQTLARFLRGRSLEGFTTIILLLLIIGGVIMVSLGVIGHYIAKIYDEVKARPRYIIAERTDASDAP